jgi:hypothetical protein
VPGRSPHEAVHDFLAPFEQNLAILDGRGQITIRRSGTYRTGVDYAWMINAGDGLRLPKLGTFHAMMRFHVIEIDPEQHDGNSFRVSTRGYNYKLVHDELGDVWRFHWHPTGVSTHRDPHVHLPPDFLPHPTDRVTFEFVIRWCIARGAPLTCETSEADAMLATSEYQHQIHRSWRSALDQPAVNEGS